MKRILSVFSVLLIALFVSACATTQPTVEEQEQEQVEDAFERVYNQYRSGLILDGAATYTVVRGDTLSAITRRNYGVDNGFFFPLIMLASSDIVLDPDLIEPGMELTIPNLQINIDNPAARERIKSFLYDIAAVYEKKGKPETQSRLNLLADSL
jgi:hypothetical protein